MKPGTSAIHDHFSQFSHTPDFENAKVLYNEENSIRKKIAGCLFMKDDPLLENNSSSFKLLL